MFSGVLNKHICKIQLSVFFNSLSWLLAIRLIPYYRYRLSEDHKIAPVN